tara:strand:- start:99 stop:290 length:192 start_codon:yes stop_codon:yes gene_type:complete
MRIGGYTLDDKGYGLEVKEYESGWSFWLQGDSADQFRAEWETWQEKRDNNFRKFLNHHEWTLA